MSLNDIPYTVQEQVKHNLSLNAQVKGMGDWSRTARRKRAKLNASRIKMSRAQLRAIFN